jgi:hypothetical protein
MLPKFVGEVTGRKRQAFSLRLQPDASKGSIMHWTAVVLAAYAAGFLEFWRLCDGAPAAQDEATDAA